MDKISRECFYEIEDLLDELVYKKTGNCNTTKEQDEDLANALKGAKDRLMEEYSHFVEEVDYIMSQDYILDLKEAQTDKYASLGFDYNRDFGGVD